MLHSMQWHASARVVVQASTRTASPLLLPNEFAVCGKVRAYEVDQYGVVNNAVYVQYLQHGRPRTGNCSETLDFQKPQFKVFSGL
jgi:hypothetical protein